VFWVGVKMPLTGYGYMPVCNCLTCVKIKLTYRECLGCLTIFSPDCANDVKIWSVFPAALFNFLKTFGNFWSANLLPIPCGISYVMHARRSFIWKTQTFSKDKDSVLSTSVGPVALRRGAKGEQFPGAKSSNKFTSTFFSTVHLLPKELRFKHGGAKLASCPGRYPTSLRPCVEQRYERQRWFIKNK